VRSGKINRVAEVNFPTRWAHFRLLAFEAPRRSSESGTEHRETALALVLGELSALQNDPPIVRIHSQCTTGDVFHSLRCDCHDQLHMAMRAIAWEGAGVLLYEQQEGRGIGLLEKLRAYELQDQGLDTIEANLQIGHPVDARDYALVADVLVLLGIRSIRLMTDNPEKIRAVIGAGIEIVERLSATVPFDQHSARYVATKREKLGHLTSPTQPATAAFTNPDPATLQTEKGMTLV
jgi:GTP cyclohydrolase II